VPQLIIEVVADPRKLTRGLNEATRSTKHFSREMEGSFRGAVAGAGVFRSLGRSIAFASGGYLAFHEVSGFLRDSINAAREAGVAQRSLAAQMKASGESFDANRERIEKVALSYGKFGFQNDEVIQALTVLERGTGKVNKSLGLLTLTGNIARARNISLAASAAIVAKVFGGQETALRRAVPGLPKYAHGMTLITLAAQKMAGQMRANTTTSEQFGATLHDTEEIVGKALLPTLNKYLTSLSQWLEKMNQSGELQRDVAKITRTLSDATADFKTVLDDLNAVTGSTTNTVKLLFEAFVAFKTVQLVSSFKQLATNIGLVGTNAKTATGEVEALNTATGGGRGGGGRGGGRGPIIPITDPRFNIPNRDLRAPGGLSRLKNIPIPGIGELAAIITTVLSVQREQRETKTLTALLARAGGGQRIFGDTFQGHRAGGTPFLSTSGMFTGQSVAVRTIDGQTWVIPTSRLKAMLGEAANVKPPAGALGPVGLDPTSPARITSAERQRRILLNRQIFDARITRQLDRVQDLPLTGQLQRLRYIAAEVKAKEAMTKDATKRNQLEDVYVQILRQEKSVTQQIADKQTQMILQRRRWFDTSISRQLDRVQDLPLGKQLQRLRYIADEIRAKIAITKDATYRNSLEDQLVQILRDEKTVQGDITAKIKEGNQALKDRADAIKSAIIGRLQGKQQRDQDAKAVKDARDTLKLYQQIGGKGGIAAARAALSAAITQQQIDVLSGQKATLTKGGVFTLGNTITVNVHGVTDPDKVARMVVAAIKRGERKTGVQSRGPTAGTYRGPH
jgi:hypothetical protein